MPRHMEGIHWAPKVSPAKIWQLYQNDARGAIDEVLVLDVGLGLFLRCRSILLVTNREVECPRCQAIFAVPREGETVSVECPTPNCGWQTTPERYHASWRHQDLLGAAALLAYRTFHDAYERATSVNERMFLIDQVIHAFHWDLKLNLPNRSAANNLIAGAHRDVVALLDKLAYNGTASAAEIKVQWRETVQTMWRRRRGQL